MLARTRVRCRGNIRATRPIGIPRVGENWLFEFNCKKRRGLPQRAQRGSTTPSAYDSRGELRAFDRLIFAARSTRAALCLCTPLQAPEDRYGVVDPESLPLPSRTASHPSAMRARRGGGAVPGRLPMSGHDKTKGPSKRTYHAHRGIKHRARTWQEDERARERQNMPNGRSGLGREALWKLTTAQP
jgi:hypothetical protein